MAKAPGGNSERAQLRRDILRMRAELRETVSVLEERLDVPKRFAEFRVESRRKARRWAHRNPVPAAVAFTVVTALAGVTVWAIAKRIYGNV